MSVRTRSISQTLAGLFLVALLLFPLTSSAHEGEDHADEPAPAMKSHEPDQAHEHGSPAHDHAIDHGQPEGFGRAIRYLGKFHPVVVHFPIALIITAAFAELLALVSRKNAFSEAAYFVLVVGAGGAAAAVGLGWAAGAFADYQAEIAGVPVLGLHRWLGTTSGLFVLLTLGLALRARKKNSPGRIKAYRAALFTSAILVSVTGHFGSALIYGLDHFLN